MMLLYLIWLCGVRSKIPLDFTQVCTWSKIPWDLVGWGGEELGRVVVVSWRCDYDLRCDDGECCYVGELLLVSVLSTKTWMKIYFIQKPHGVHLDPRNTSTVFLCTWPSDENIKYIFLQILLGQRMYPREKNMHFC